MNCKCSMEHINDDMDELFRRASEGYPLKTDSADWNAVAKKLAEQEVKNKPAESRNYKHLLWLLLLLPLSLVYFYMPGKNERPANTLKNNIVKQNEKSTAASANNIVKDTLQQTSLSKNMPPKFNTVKPMSIVTDKSLRSINYNQLYKQTKGRLIPTTDDDNSTFLSDIPSPVSATPQTLLSNHKKTNVVPSASDKSIANAMEENATKIVNDTGSDKAKQGDENKNSIEKTNPTLQKIPRKQKERGLYAGIVIGPDISTIKFQTVKNIGVSMGILTGYKINKKISIESGVLWDIKNYYSEGEYFNTKNIRMPANAKIKEITGTCNMIEVPLMVKYNFKSSGKTNLSASAGISSYFMQKESYDYEMVRYGQQYPYSSTYKNSSTDLFAVANIALGYNREIKRGIILRVEPYIKIPVKGVGIGSLPIMSTGLHIGITSKLSK